MGWTHSFIVGGGNTCRGGGGGLLKYTFPTIIQHTASVLRKRTYLIFLANSTVYLNTTNFIGNNDNIRHRITSPKSQNIVSTENDVLEL